MKDQQPPSLLIKLLGLSLSANGKYAINAGVFISIVFLIMIAFGFN